MEIKATAKRIVTELADTEWSEQLPEIEKILWEQLRELLNTAHNMRKYQIQYFKYKDAVSLQAAKKHEADFDKLLHALKQERTQPKLDM